MGEAGGTVTYLYWSERRVQRILEDNGIQLPVSTTKITSPTLQGLVPTIEYAVSGSTMQRAKIADLIESTLGQAVISRFDSEPGPRYAKGTGTVVFGEFINDFERERLSTRRALIFSQCDYSNEDRNSVAICLFGSMDNFADYVSSSAPISEAGWTSSGAPSVLSFLKGEWSDEVDEPSREEIALDALQIATSQGGGGCDPLKGWRRGFTYGDIQDVSEWLVEIYLDVDLVDVGMVREGGFRRIIVGAPVWVRTPRLRAIRLYQEYQLKELEPPLPLLNDVSLVSQPLPSPVRRVKDWITQKRTSDRK